MSRPKFISLTRENTRGYCLTSTSAFGKCVKELGSTRFIVPEIYPANIVRAAVTTETFRNCRYQP